MSRWGGLALLLIFVAALALRLPNLSVRPLHNDEGVNAVKVTELWQQGHYAYDPDEYHGPTLHYFTLPVLALSGAKTPAELGDAVFRIAPVLFGAGLILLLLLLRDGMGSQAICWAALFMAISPAMVFYSRYFIHEILLVFFTALALGAGWRYLQSPSLVWAALTGIAAGLMFTTKETFVITLAAMGMALLLSVWCNNRGMSPLILLKAHWNAAHAGAAVVAAILIWLLFFSSFFHNAAGLLDSMKTYLPWLKRAGGHSPHIHPWYFYLHRLAWFHPAKSPVWSEALILGLAVLGAIQGLRTKAMLLRYLTVYTLLLTAAYSLISYKTPWCMLSFLHGMILLAGAGAAWLAEAFRSRAAKAAVTTILLLLSIQLGCQAWRASVTYAADPKNPYVYAQTSQDLLRLIARTEGIAKINPAGWDTIVKVMMPKSDYWPLPWYLRRFNHVGWYDKVPADPFAPIVIVGSKLDARLDEKSDRKWIMAGITQLRPGTFVELYVELELWKKYVETLPRNRDE